VGRAEKNCGKGAGATTLGGSGLYCGGDDGGKIAMGGCCCCCCGGADALGVVTARMVGTSDALAAESGLGTSTTTSISNGEICFMFLYLVFFTF
jgi:hypothetical protein